VLYVLEIFLYLNPNFDLNPSIFKMYLLTTKKLTEELNQGKHKKSLSVFRAEKLHVYFILGSIIIN